MIIICSAHFSCLLCITPFGWRRQLGPIWQCIYWNSNSCAKYIYIYIYKRSSNPFVTCSAHFSMFTMHSSNRVKITSFGLGPIWPCFLNRLLMKFRLLYEGDVQDATFEAANIWTLSQYPLLAIGYLKSTLSLCEKITVNIIKS